MGVNGLPKTVTRQRRDCDLNPGPSAPESSTLATRLPSHPSHLARVLWLICQYSLRLRHRLDTSTSTAVVIFERRAYV